MTEFATRLRAQQKRKLFETLLEAGVAALHLDPRAAGVAVPGHLTDQPVLVLNFSFRYGVKDFRFDDKGVEASLSFSRQPFYCVVPWSAVFAVTSDDRTQGSVWQEDLPEELGEREPAGSPPEAELPVRPGRSGPRAAAARRPSEPRTASRKANAAAKVGAVDAGDGQEPSESPTEKPKRMGLRLVGASESPPEQAPPPPSDDAEAPVDPAPRPAGGHLRRIK
jgi:stringent starvation protein B